MLEDCWRILVSSIFEFLTPSTGNDWEIRVQYRGGHILEIFTNNREQKFLKYNELTVSGYGRKNFFDFILVFGNSEMVKKIICSV